MNTMCSILYDDVLEKHGLERYVEDSITNGIARLTYRVRCKHPFCTLDHDEAFVQRFYRITPKQHSLRMLHRGFCPYSENQSSAPSPMKTFTDAHGVPMCMFCGNNPVTVANGACGHAYSCEHCYRRMFAAYRETVRREGSSQDFVDELATAPSPTSQGLVCAVCAEPLLGGESKGCANAVRLRTRTECRRCDVSMAVPRFVCSRMGCGVAQYCETCGSHDDADCTRCIHDAKYDHDLDKHGRSFIMRLFYQSVPVDEAEKRAREEEQAEVMDSESDDSADEVIESDGDDEDMARVNNKMPQHQHRPTAGPALGEGSEETPSSAGQRGYLPSLVNFAQWYRRS
jgi:hypothetical protein